MRDKRRWSLWPGRILSHLNNFSGLACFGGFVVLLAGQTVVSGSASTILTVVGLVISAVAFSCAIYCSFPPAMLDPASQVGQSLKIKDLDNLWPPVGKIAIVGPTQAGKTTLKNRLQFEVPQHERTQSATATIVSIATNPISYLAVLDGQGETFSQQFKIAEPADYLCLVIDHNISDTDSRATKTRRSQTTEFLAQIRSHLRDVDAPTKKWIELLVNKRDRWQLLPANEQEEFSKYYREQAHEWEAGNFSKNVQAHPHSNSDGNDVARFMKVLKSTLAQDKAEGNGLQE